MPRGGGGVTPTGGLGATARGTRGPGGGSGAAAWELGWGRYPGTGEGVPNRELPRGCGAPAGGIHL